MPKKRALANADIINGVLDSYSAMLQAKIAYTRAQDDHLRVLRNARSKGETLENLAEALQCSKQWIHKWTTFGREHNRVYAKSA